MFKIDYKINLYDGYLYANICIKATNKLKALNKFKVINPKAIVIGVENM